MVIILTTPQEAAEQLAERAKQKRLLMNLSQQSLAAHSGVSLSVIKKFEKVGKISLESLLKIALSLGSLDEFEYVFKKASPESFHSLHELLDVKERKRGRK
jgi:transcriptional regulator with XRE-family HTH domain